VYHQKVLTEAKTLSRHPTDLASKIPG
jgi:hypothetical protein